MKILSKRFIVRTILVIIGTIGVGLLLYQVYFASKIEQYLANQICQIIEKQFKREVTLGKLHLKLLTPQVSISDLAIARNQSLSEGTLLSAKKVFAKASLWSLLTQHIEISDIVIEQPAVWIEFDEHGKSNLPVSEPKETTPSTKKPSPIVERLAFPHIQLIDAQVYFANKQIPLTFSVQRFNTTLAFVLKDFSADGTLALQGGELEFQDRGKIALTLSGGVTFQQNALTVSKMQVQANTSQITLNGTVRNLSQPQLDLAVQTQLALQELDRFLKLDQHLSGMAAFDGTVTGSIPDVIARGHVTCQQVTAWKLDFANVALDAIYHQRQIELPQISLESFDGKLTGSGKLSFAEPPKYQAALTVERLNITEANRFVNIHLPLAGRLSGQIEAVGKSFAFEDLVLHTNVQFDQVQAYGVNAPHVEAQINIEHQQLLIPALRAEVFEGNVTGAGQMNLSAQPDYQVKLEMQNVHVEPIMALIPQPPDVSGVVSGTLQASGATFAFEALTLDANFQAQDVNAYNVQAKTLETVASIRNRELSLARFTAQLFGGQVVGQGKLVLAGNALPKFDVRATLKNLSTQVIMRQFVRQPDSGSPFGLEANVAGQVAFTGQSYRLQDISGNVTLNGKGQIQTQEDKLPLAVAINGALADQQVKIKQLQVQSDALNLTTTGTLQLIPLELALDYDVAAQNIQPVMQQLRLFVPGIAKDSPLLRFSGKIDRLHGAVRGTLADLSIRAETQLTNPDVVWATAETVSADITYQGKMLQIQHALIRNNSAQVEVTAGQIDLRAGNGPLCTLPVVLKSGEIADYLHIAKQDFPITGTLTTTRTTLGGPVSNLRSSLTLEVKQGSAWGQRFDQLSGKVVLGENQVRIESLTIKQNGGKIALNGFFGFDQSFQADVTATGVNFHDIDAFRNVAMPYDGQAEVTLHVEGSVANPLGKANIRLINLSYQGNSTEDITCDIVMENRAIRAQVATFRKKLITTFQLSLTPDLLYRMEMLMEQAALEQILSVVVKLDGISGLISGKITSEGSLRQLKQVSATVKLHQLDLNVYGQQVTNSKDIDVVITPEQLVVNSLEMRGKELGLFAQGKLDFHGNFDLAVDGILDLRAIQTFLPETVGILSLAGRLQLICNVHGTFLQPELEGVAELMEGAVRLQAYPETIKNLHGKLAFTKGQIAVNRLQGAVGGGTFVAYGSMSYQGLTPKTFSVDVEGENITVQNLIEAATVKVSPRIRFEGDVKQQKLTGKIFVNNALYTKDLDFRTFLEKNRNIAIPSAQQGKPLEFELSIEAPQDIQVKNKYANISLRANLRIEGTTAKPQIGGRIEVLQGKVQFGDITYQVLSGVLDFVDPLQLNPEMNIQVETTIQEYTIALGVQGNLDQFTLDMRSDPELPKSQITRMLAAGSNTGSTGYNVVTKPLQTLVEGQIERAVKLDRFTVDVDPLLSGSSGNEAAPRVTLGKRLFQDLLITYSTTLGGTERSQIVEIEYQLSDNLSLTARRDEKGEIDTSFTFKFKIK